MAANDLEGARAGGVDGTDQKYGDTWRDEMMHSINAVEGEHKFAGTSTRNGNWVQIPSTPGPRTVALTYSKRVYF